jgi:hypothetical protein
MGAVKWQLRSAWCKKEVNKKQKPNLQNWNWVLIQQQLFCCKRVIIVKLHGNKATRNGLGRMDCKVQRRL